MKKKTVLALMVMCMAFSVTACGDKEESSTPAAESSSEETAEETAEPAAEEPEEEAEEAGDDAKESETGESARLVSVDNVEDYVTIGEYKGLELDNIVMPVSDEDVESEIEFRLQDSSVEVADGTLEQGDFATVNFTATIDGNEFDGGTEENYEFYVGDSGQAEGFDSGLIGMKKGESRELTITFPEDYYDPAVPGKTAVYTVTLQKFTRTPELTDEWVAANSEVKTVDEYREAVKKELEDNANEMASYDLYATAWSVVLDASEVKEFPQEDIDAARQAYMDLNDQYIAEAGMDLNSFLESQGMTQEEYEDECTRYAEAKVEQNLIVQGIMDKEGLSLDDKETQDLEKRLVQEYGVTDVNEMAELYGQQEVNESLALLRVEKFIVDNATIDQKVGGGDELAENEDALTEDAAYDTELEGDTAGDYSEEYMEEDMISEEMPEEDMVVVE